MPRARGVAVQAEHEDDGAEETDDAFFLPRSREHAARIGRA